MADIGDDDYVDPITGLPNPIDEIGEDLIPEITVTPEDWQRGGWGDFGDFGNVISWRDLFGGGFDYGPDINLEGGGSGTPNDSATSGDDVVSEIWNQMTPAQKAEWQAIQDSWANGQQTHEDLVNKIQREAQLLANAAVDAGMGQDAVASILNSTHAAYGVETDFNQGNIEWTNILGDVAYPSVRSNTDSGLVDYSTLDAGGGSSVSTTDVLASVLGGLGTLGRSSGGSSSSGGSPDVGTGGSTDTPPDTNPGTEADYRYEGDGIFTHLPSGTQVLVDGYDPANDVYVPGDIYSGPASPGDAPGTIVTGDGTDVGDGTGDTDGGLPPVIVMPSPDTGGGGDSEPVVDTGDGSGVGTGDTTVGDEVDISPPPVVDVPGTPDPGDPTDVGVPDGVDIPDNPTNPVGPTDVVGVTPPGVVGLPGGAGPGSGPGTGPGTGPGDGEDDGDDDGEDAPERIAMGMGSSGMIMRPPKLAEIKYYYDVGGPSIFAPTDQGELPVDSLPWEWYQDQQRQKTRFSDGGIVEDVEMEELLRILET